MALTLYGTLGSPPVAAVRLVCAALGVEYDLKLINVVAGETKTPEFLKINPQHTVPTILDGDFALWDSHAIAAYLADKVGAASWYPKDLKKRAIVNQRLHFDNAMLFTRIRDLVEPIFYGDCRELLADKVRRLEEATQLLGDLLQEGGWLAGDSPTIADCCAAANASWILGILPTMKAPAKVTVWLKRCEDTFPDFEALIKPSVSLIVKALTDRIKKP